MAPRTLSTLALLAALTLARPGAARDLVLPATGEAAVTPPMVVLTLGDRPSTARKAAADDRTDLLGDLPALAILDTGASGHVLSAATAARFGVATERGSRYIEVGMSGEHAFAVSEAVSVAVSDLEPEAAEDDAPRRRRPRPGTFRLPGQRLLLHEGPNDPTAALLSPGTMVDVVGMPLIRERVIEIVPDAEAIAALAVRLHPSAAGLRVDAWVALELVDFNRRHPRNRGPRPSLATNPLVPGVTLTHGTAEAEGDWLLDTGAVCSMISTATARRLGLVDRDGTPARRPDFALPLGGVGGGHQTLPGFRLDFLRLGTTDGRTLEFPNPAVVVHDVSTIDADGEKVTLDGILGMNLLLPSGSGMTMLGMATQLPAPFARVVIDVPRERMGLALRE